MKHLLNGLICVVLVFTIVLISVSCKKKPAKLEFRNMKNFSYLDQNNYNDAGMAVLKDSKLYDDYYTDCTNGITTKPGIMYGVSFEKPIGVSEVKIQIVNDISGAVLSNEIQHIAPDMTSLLSGCNLEAKGKYKVNIISKDEIIAQGFIEYK